MDTYITSLKGMKATGQMDDYATAMNELRLIASTFIRVLSSGIQDSEIAKNCMVPFIRLLECIGDPGPFMGVLKMALEWRNRPDNDPRTSETFCSIAVRMMDHLKAKAAELVIPSIGEWMEGAATEPKIERYKYLEGKQEEYSFYQKLETQTPGWREFVLIEDVERISGSLRLLAASMYCVDKENNEIIVPMTELSMNWLEYKYTISEINVAAWELLWELVRLRRKTPDVSHCGLVLKRFMEETRRDLDFLSIEVMFNVVNHVIQDQRVNLDENDQLLVFRRGFEYLISLMDKLDKLTGPKQYGFFPESQSAVTEKLDRIAPAFAFFTHCFSRYAAVTSAAFLSPEVQQFLRQSLDIPVRRLFAARMFSDYLKVSKDVGKLMELLPFLQEVMIPNREESDQDFRETIFEMLWEFFANCRVDEGTARGYYAFLEGCLNSDWIIRDEQQISSDLALFALSELILRNRQYFNLGEIAEDWHSFLPVMVKMDEAAPVYEMVAVLMEDKCEFYYDEGNLAELLVKLVKNDMIKNVSQQVGAVWARFLKDCKEQVDLREVIEETYDNWGFSEAERALVDTFIQKYDL
jgi:hypothetical protein